MTPRPTQAPSGAAAPTAAASPAAPASTAAPANLSPRAGNGDDAAVDPADPSADGAVLGLSREMSLAELFPAEAAMGAAPPDVLPGDGEIAVGHVGGAGPDSEGSSRLPLVAGIIVTLVILLSGGGFLWWRNLDSEYWETA